MRVARAAKTPQRLAASTYKKIELDEHVLIRIVRIGVTTPSNFGNPLHLLTWLNIRAAQQPQVAL